VLSGGVHLHIKATPPRIIDQERKALGGGVCPLRNSSQATMILRLLFGLDSRWFGSFEIMLSPALHSLAAPAGPYWKID